jgi:hypothetical protein
MYVFKNSGIKEKILKKIFWKKKFMKILIFFSIFHSVKSPVSGKENVRFPDSPDFENSPDFRTGRDVR